MNGPCPPYPLELIEESRMPADMDLAIRRLLIRCFPVDAEAFSQSRAWHQSAPTFSIVCREGTALLGHVGVVLRTVRCGHTPLTVAGVQNLCVVPERRGSGLAPRLMLRAMEEARTRQIRFGLLFCVPELEPFYQWLGWSTCRQPITMLDDAGRPGPITDKNIAMFIELGPHSFPPGPIDLNGRDW